MESGCGTGDTALFQQGVQCGEQVQIQLHESNSTSEKHAPVVNHQVVVPHILRRHGFEPVAVALAR
ncbi:hypothetical protein Snoj_14450 [Streptomyces nojiriensis]|uniref:Uncharacterized protein n=1 Tax=Streptomyces nojiriensis TaxID=66374 RepID=A0ABQ3SH96_9ACTN|nr:hypothetical protein GCM10010205_45570 [Streptomyces nojiriensis]GHI67527.1 hypothetical protein Snoj_14450 [Streptomyces nojiriensis]